MTQLVLRILMVLFPVSEIALGIARRSKSGGAQSEDRGSLRLFWISIALGIGLAIAAVSLRVAPLPGSRETQRIVAVVLLASGLALRWAAILTLGRLFTVDVAIHQDHAVVRTGLYRFVRHPSYTGLLIAFLGLGVSFGNWLSIAVLLTPILFAVVNRVSKEERALHNALGEDYATYCARTKRFIPGVL